MPNIYYSHHVSTCLRTQYMCVPFSFDLPVIPSDSNHVDHIQLAYFSLFAFFFFVRDTHFHPPLDSSVPPACLWAAMELCIKWKVFFFFWCFKFPHRKSGVATSVWYNQSIVFLPPPSHLLLQFLSLLFVSNPWRRFSSYPPAPFMPLQHCHVFCMLLCSEIRHAGKGLF